MPEEACEVQSEDNRALPDKNKKRRFKTPDQVEALEKFYSEHKYPSEELKSQFAVSLGLTEKQISGWFCHRRLKDKRLLSGEASANGKQDRSSGIIIPDHGSGHKQDSCGSTKEGGTRHFDHREVQSRGFNVQDPLVADLAYEHGRHHDGKDSDLDDTSSGSSLPLQKRLHSQNGDPANVAAFSYLPETENIARATHLMGVRTRPGPSGYLKLKGRAENPAITSVKRQLGRHYREDGPPLSVEFDPLPPGAFESSMNNPDNEPPDLSVPDVQHSPDVVMNCDVYNAEMSPRNPHLDGSNFRIKPSSLGHSNYIGHQSMWKPAFSSRRTPFSKQKSSTELEGFSHETTVYDRRPYKMMAQHDYHGRRKGFSDSGQRDSWPYKSEDVTPEKLQGEHFDSKYPNLLVRRSGSFDMETKRISKDDKFIRKRTAINESSNSATVQGGKRVWEEFLEQRCERKAPKADPPLRTNQTKRSAAADRPSSFSEDETAETSSSGD